MRETFEQLKLLSDQIVDTESSLSKLQAERNEAIVALGEAGISAAEMQKPAGLTRQQISRILAAAGALPSSTEVRFSDLRRTAIVTVSDEPLGDGRPGVTRHSSAADLALRALTSWPLKASRQRDVQPARLIAREKKTGIILADWDLDPNEPTCGNAFRPIDQSKIDPRGVVGRRLNMEGNSVNIKVTWTKDLGPKK